MKRMVLLAACLISLTSAPLAQPRSGSLDTLLGAAVEQKQVPMIVATVANAQGILYEHASGAAKDAIFSIASMTKPLTSVAVMQLVDAGRVKLDEPAATYAAELGAVRVLDGAARRAPKSAPTVRQLLTHTAGFGYEFMNKELFGLVAKKELPSMMAGGDAFLRAPLLFDPGSRWQYGINTDWLGRIVERVSGQTLDAYFREKIFQPLGMTDSFFVVPAEKRSRVVPTFQRNPDGPLTQLPPPPAPAVEFFSGGGGLFSTAPDYTKFVRALLGDGQLDGRRILSAESVAAMAKNHIGNLQMQPLSSQIPAMMVGNAVMPGSLDKFGLGFALNSKPTDAGRGANTMSWAGIFNTFFWIDRERQVGAVVLTQLLPFLDPQVKKLVDEFDRLVYATTKTR
jgi:methyl acetate hydrolase